MKLASINSVTKLKDKAVNSFFTSNFLSINTTLTVALIYLFTAPGNFTFVSASSFSDDLQSSSLKSDRSIEQQNSASSITEVVIVDETVREPKTLVANLPDSTPVYYLNSERDGIEQITHILQAHQNLEAVHILGHGNAGQMNLGSGILNQTTSKTQAKQIAAWGQALNVDGDILLYGCDFAKGEAGQTTLRTLAQLTNADIAASNDYTGNKSLGGDWDLEIAQGKIESHLALDKFAQSNYQQILAPTVANPDLPSKVVLKL